MPIAPVAVARPAAAPSASLLAVPLAFTLFLAALGLVPSVRENPRLFWSFLGAAAVLAGWNVVLATRARALRRHLKIDVVLRAQHYLQGSVHLSILLYWGWYWRTVYDSAPLIVGQLAFAYAFDALLAWSRRDDYTFGFGPFPIIFSTNLFLWFKPDWFYLQFTMVAVGFLAKELIRWQKDGRLTHIFNPSSFTLFLFSVILIVTGKTGISWGPEIASTQYNPPHIFLWIFLASLPGQFLFGVAPMTLAAVATTFGFSFVYHAVTGMHYFPEPPIPIAVFLGMHLLFTDPSTAPRTELGRLVFGVMYGIGVVTLAWLLTYLHLPDFYDKLLPVPILNLTIRRIDRIARSDTFKRFDPGSFGRTLLPRQRNFAYMCVWALIFLTMSVVTGAQQTLQRADSLMAQGSVDQAITRYREYLQREPNDGEGYNDLGVALMSVGRNSEAVTSLQRAASLQPDSAETALNLGQVLVREGRFADAIAPLHRAAELRPANAVAQDQLGRALMQAGRMREAIAPLQHAVELNAKDADARYNLAHALTETGQTKAAAGQLRDALSIKPDWLQAMESLAWIDATEPDALEPDEAMRLASRAVDLTGRRDAHTLDVLAAAYAANGRFAEAARTAETALTFAGNEPTVVAEIKSHLEVYRSLAASP